MGQTHIWLSNYVYHSNPNLSFLKRFDFSTKIFNYPIQAPTITIILKIDRKYHVLLT